MSAAESFNLERLLTDVAAWASMHTDIQGVLLVGSYARGTARPDSDVDLMILTENPEVFRTDETWMQELDWSGWRAPLLSWRDEQYGPVWSRHVLLQDASDVEFSFGLPDWANIDPLDTGTLNVVRTGARIVTDPRRLLARLLDSS
ncbi:nucleotidyltransferase domain-containing protein [Deinococcus radiomollis]|uniref:nucleotidyltransferase domain-containing protein n=1 Tax=Deinococcus radiomollis TaxID=468916 RepID=UPI003892B227